MRIVSTVSLFLMPAALAAQSTQISGIVLDSSGAAVPAALATLVNQDNGVRRVARTSSEGVYAIPAVQPGPYKLTVRKDGFRSIARTGFHLEPGQSARLDFFLEVGQVDEVITIESSMPSLEAEAAAQGLVVPPAYVSRLPLNGRGLLTLLELSPGAVITPVRNPGESGQFSVNGQRANANLIAIDGLSANFGMQEQLPGHALSGSLPALSAIGSLHGLLPSASLQEFRLLTSNGPVETGRFSGGVLALTSRSGGSEWHGGARHFLRNEKLDANDWFANRLGSPRAPLRWNHFGASAGGPVPRAAATFLFGTWEAFRLRQSEDVNILVPALEQRAGFSARNRAAIAFYPVPNSAAITPPEFGVHRARVATGASQDSGGLRLDHAPGPRTNLFTRLQVAPSSALRAGAAGNTRSDYSVRDIDYSTAQLTAAAGIALSPSAYLDWRVNRSRMAVWQSTRQTPVPGALPWNPAAFSLPEAIEGQAVEWEAVWPGSNWSPLQAERRRRSVQSQLQTIASLSMVRGAHQPKVGADYRQIRPELAPAPLSASIALPDLPGAPPITRLVRREPVALRLHNVSLWAGDTWKLHPRITIDAGLRWEWNPPPSARGPARPVLVVGGPDSSSTAELASSGGDWWRPSHRDFAPRLSVAWRVLPGGGIVLRAGSGLHYNLGSGHVLYTLADQPGYSATALVAGPVDSLRLSHLDGAPPAYPGVAGAVWNLRTPATLQSTVSADIALPGTGSLSTGWVSTLGRRLVRSEHLPLDAGPYRFLQLATHHGSSNYHAWQSRFRSRNTHGLEALISYAWAHSIDNGSRDSETRLAFARRLDRGSSDFDVRHALSAAFLYAIPRSGIRLDGIVRARSGFPFNPVIAGWLPEPGEPPALTYEPMLYRPDLLSSEPVWLYGQGFPGGRALNTAAFPVPPRLVMGSLGRNALRGFGFRQLDFTVHRRFAPRGIGLTLRAECFNALNRAQFAQPQASYSNGPNPPSVPSVIMLNQQMGRDGLGGSPASGLLPVLHSGGPRSIQLSVGLDF